MDEKVKATIRAKQLEALTLKQWKVTVITMGTHNRTVMAVDEQAAMKEVLQGQGGRDAGSEGPVSIGARIQDMAIITPPVTLQQIVAEITGGTLKSAPEQTAPEPLIKPGG